MKPKLPRQRLKPGQYHPCLRKIVRGINALWDQAEAQAEAREAAQAANHQPPPAAVPAPATKE